MPVSRQQRDWLVLVCVNLAVPATVAWKRYSEGCDVTVAVITTLISLVALNAVVISTIRSRCTREGLTAPKWLLSLGVALAVFSAVSSIVAVAIIPVRNDYLKLALSDIPLSRIQPERKRLVVELIRRRAANSRENDRAIAEAKSKPLFPPLYSPESFADLDVMNKTMRELRKYVEVDTDYGEKQQQALADFREKMAKADPEYLKSWDAEREGQEALEAATLGAEKEWFSGVIALYEFASKHYDVVKLYGSPLESSDPVMQEFKRRLAENKALHNKLETQVGELAKRQQKSRNKTVAFVP